MAIFRSFRAYRPSKENQSLIPALPYDVMSSAEAKEMAAGNPLSFLHVDKAEIDLPENTDIYDESVYKKAKENLDFLKSSGAMLQDEKPCFYIYRQIMNGRSQTGIAGCASIDDYINNIIKKHEHTLEKKEIDRIKHVDICDANTGPIFLTYRNNDSINTLVADWTENHEPTYDFVSDGVNQTIWVIDDEDKCSELSNLFNDVNALYIADGHHRCASAVKVGQRRRQANPDYTGNEEFNFFLAVAFPDSELEIMDYNRVVKDLNSLSEEEFLTALKKNFEVKEEASQFKPAQKHSFGMLLGNQWYSIKANSSIIDNNDPVARLDVSILQKNVLDPILGIKNPKTDDRIDFIGGIRGLGELEKRVNTDMTLAFAMYPTTVEDLMAIADADLIMPPKSTWFEPKLLSGLFIHNLSE